MKTDKFIKNNNFYFFKEIQIWFDNTVPLLNILKYILGITNRLKN